MYKHKVPPLPNLRSNISKAQSIEDGFSENETSDEEFFSLNSYNTSHKESYGKNVYNSHPAQSDNSFNIPQSIGNTPYINHFLSTNQPNLVDKIYTTDSSAKSGLYFQDENHLIQWLETHKDIVLKALNSICSLPITSSQVS